MVNDQHPHAGYVGDDAYATGSFTTYTTSENGYDGGYQTAAYGTGSYGTGTHAPASYDTGAHQTADPLYGGYDAGHGGQYDTAQWSDTTASTASAYTAYADPSATSGQWGAASWSQEQGDQQYAAATAPTYGTTGEWYGQAAGGDASAPGAWDTTGTTDTTGAFDTAAFDTAAYAPASYETGAYDATAWNHASEETRATAAFVPEQYDYSPADDGPRAEQAEPTAEADGDTGTTYGGDSDAEGLPAQPAGDFAEDLPDDLDGDGPSTQTFEVLDDLGGPDDREHADDADALDALDALDEPVAVAASARTARRAGGSRGRRRTPARRSALLTVAVPSACVMGVAGIAAASVSGLTGTEQKDDGKAVTAADPASVKPAVANSALDTQLAALDAEALDFGDRASRTQERIDLKARQEAERKKREEEAKRREAMRPKFALPVALRQLSAGYGQSGVNWMSLHTGIDFPVQYGTPVMAATDGTVRTQWNGAYGNMVIVTAKDGTETWYCHLSSAKIRSGSVKAGDVIAYSGNSGNSTGPHLHFEVRPGGGAAIDPEAWLRSHGLSPTG
ncbi:M23 family metallopeptidase [Streptomyces fradiae]|uniref:M23 family metallopeptidase n=1 Tax=Streptomyces fradiae TaxID=1906 RepID=UPI003F4D1CD4